MMYMATVILIALSASMFFSRCEARSSKHICTPCLTKEECDQEPEEPCPFGVVRDYCNRNVCGKGPSELCEGPFLIWGRCGSGMHCLCNRCVGCYLNTLQCADSTDVRLNC